MLILYQYSQKENCFFQIPKNYSFFTWQLIIERNDTKWKHFEIRFQLRSIGKLEFFAYIVFCTRMNVVCRHKKGMKYILISFLIQAYQIKNSRVKFRLTDPKLSSLPWLLWPILLRTQYEYTLYAAVIC